MTIDYSQVQRDGTQTIIELAKALCKIVSAVKHIIIAKFPDNSAIIVLLEAIEALCPLIAAAEQQTLVMGGNNDVPLDNPENIVGIDPSRPPASAPDIA